MKNTIIVDIDGTISKVGNRLKFLLESPKDWDSFYNACFEDQPIREIIDFLALLEDHYIIVFCTGRRESVREITTKWIYKHLGISTYKNNLLMRPNNDYRHDTIVKPEQLEKAGIELKNIAFVLEDRNSMVKKWRDLGLTCLQVADGDF
ncbi:MAG: hypothetical protein QM499_01095 [Flavobacteriaceae bacterium]